MVYEASSESDINIFHLPKIKIEQFRRSGAKSSMVSKWKKNHAIAAAHKGACISELESSKMLQQGDVTKPLKS